MDELGSTRLFVLFAQFSSRFLEGIATLHNPARQFSTYWKKFPAEAALQSKTECVKIN
jgi:hypothetical protein